ncbi:sigma-54 interaction domain-containing protein [Achromobacter aloeverae]
MGGERADSFGLLIVDGQDAAVFAVGCVKDPGIRDVLLHGLEEKRTQGGGMIALPAAAGAVAVYRVFGDSIAFFVQPAQRSSTFFNLVATVDFADAILDHLLKSPYFSMVVVDEQARVRFLPPVHEKFFGIEKGSAIGKHVTEVIENTNLHEVVRSGKSEIGKLQKMGDVTRVVNRIPIVKSGKVVGAIGQVLFKGPETLQHLSEEVTHLRSELAFYRREFSGTPPYPHELQQMVGDSDAMRQLKSDIVKVAPLNVPVLIIGESGTGKELAARAIHELSPRSKNRMVFLNAAALPTSLVESELFGYEGGAFTGAGKAGRKGKFEMADGGSLFFDEIGDMPIEIQVKLLRILQDGVYERLGGNQVGHSDFRLICASNRDFQSMIADGQFRLDLYYRISGVTIRMPSLRERLDDIPALVQSILVSFADRHRATVKLVSPRVYDFLRDQPWPGNVRQLLHEVEKAAIFCDGPEITIDNFRLTGEISQSRAPKAIRGKGAFQSIPEATAALEKTMVEEALLRHRGNKKKAAEELGISRAYLYKKLHAEAD